MCHVLFYRHYQMVILQLLLGPILPIEAHLHLVKMAMVDLGEAQEEEVAMREVEMEVEEREEYHLASGGEEMYLLVVLEVMVEAEEDQGVGERVVKVYFTKIS